MLIQKVMIIIIFYSTTYGDLLYTERQKEKIEITLSMVSFLSI